MYLKLLDLSIEPQSEVYMRLQDIFLAYVLQELRTPALLALRHRRSYLRNGTSAKVN